MRAESTIKNAIAIAVAITAVAAPTALAGQDLRSPDARDASAPVAVQQDLRSPDSRDAGVVESQNFVSPDARDSIRVVPTQPAPVVVEGPSEFPWTDAGIVAALLALLATTLVIRRRHHHPGAPAVS